jgi:hypothetical protein
MIEAGVSQTAISIFGRPFAGETYSSSVPAAEAIPDELRLAGVNQTPTGIETYFGGEQAWFWTESWQAGEREAEDDIAARRGDFYESSDALLESL